VAVHVSDTHPLVWYATGRHRKLSRRALRLFEAADADAGLIYIPAVVLWELALLQRARVISLREPFGDWATLLLAKRGFDLVALDVEVIAAAGGLQFSDDPFDAAIVASALVKRLPLITADASISASRIVETVW
jgi:PIN domain nuclease of toxin-antitoxin system